MKFGNKGFKPQVGSRKRRGGQRVTIKKKQKKRSEKRVQRLVAFQDLGGGEGNEKMLKESEKRVIKRGGTRFSEGENGEKAKKVERRKHTRRVFKRKGQS